MFYLLISNSIVVSHAPLDSASYSQAFRVSHITHADDPHKNL